MFIIKRKSAFVSAPPRKTNP